MLFSIITVCFNSAKTIRQTFDSVLLQECTDYEYIVVDGASTDGTVDIIKEYEPKFQGRMRWIFEPDKGIYNAMNKGARMAKGDYLAFINSDDYYEPHALQKVAISIQENPGFDVYHGMTRAIDENGNEIECSRGDVSTLWSVSLRHPASFFRRSKFFAVGCYDEKYKIAADYDLYMNLYYKQKALFYALDYVIANFRNTGISNRSRWTMIESQKIKRKYHIISYPTLWLRLFSLWQKRFFKEI